MSERGTVTVTAKELENRMARAIAESNTSPAVAASVARALAAAEIDGHKGHGLSRIPSYCAQSLSGKVDGHASPEAEQPRPSCLAVDAAHGFAFPAFDLVVDRLPGLAREHGIAAAAIKRSHHCGVIGWHAERLAGSGVLALIFANTPKAIAPWGGKTGVFGTNPVALSAPRKDADPVVIDLATSQIARGHILKAQQAGEAIPEGWALDRQGRPTTDPEAALQGTMQPLGGAKGAALAFLIEILAAGLTGANFGFEATSFFTGEGEPPGVGQFVIAIDPDVMAGGEAFADRFEILIAAMEGQEGVRLPGSRRLAARAAAKDGVTVDAAAWAKAGEIAGDT